MALILDKTEQKIVDIIDAHRNEIIAFAKDIYTHAELGYKEYRTAEKFASFMKNLGLETKEGLAVTINTPTRRLRELTAADIMPSWPVSSVQPWL